MGNSPKGEDMLKKENIRRLVGIGVMSLFLLGCSENSFLLTEEESSKMQEGQGLEEGKRVYHAIELAGGLRADADGDYINQALLLEDGMKIVIPTKEETKQWKEREEKEQEVEAKLYEEKGLWRSIVLRR